MCRNPSGLCLSILLRENITIVDWRANPGSRKISHLSFSRSLFIQKWAHSDFSSNKSDISLTSAFIRSNTATLCAQTCLSLRVSVINSNLTASVSDLHVFWPVLLCCWIEILHLWRWHIGRWRRSGFLWRGRQKCALVSNPTASLPTSSF